MRKFFWIISLVLLTACSGGETNKATEVRDPNQPATGLPIITGEAFIGQTLEVDTSAIADGNGLGAFSYQWYRNGDPVSGATTSSYNVTAVDNQAILRVQVSFTDGDRYAESRLSDPVTATAGSVRIGGDVQQDITIFAIYADFYPGAESYSVEWFRAASVTGTPISTGVTAEDYLLTADDVGRYISVRVTAVGSLGETSVSSDAILVSASGVVIENNFAIGLPIIKGLGLVGLPLEVDISAIADEDGFDPQVIDYRWLRNGEPITEAFNQVPYTLVEADKGNLIGLIIEFRDNQNNLEILEATPIAVSNDLTLTLDTWQSFARQINYAQAATVTFLKQDFASEAALMQAMAKRYKPIELIASGMSASSIDLFNSSDLSSLCTGQVTRVVNGNQVSITFGGEDENGEPTDCEFGNLKVRGGFSFENPAGTDYTIELAFSDLTLVQTEASGTFKYGLTGSEAITKSAAGIAVTVLEDLDYVVVKPASPIGDDNISRVIKRTDYASEFEWDAVSDVWSLWIDGETIQMSGVGDDVEQAFLDGARLIMTMPTPVANTDPTSCSVACSGGWRIEWNNQVLDYAFVADNQVKIDADLGNASTDSETTSWLPF